MCRMAAWSNLKPNKKFIAQLRLSLGGDGDGLATPEPLEGFEKKGALYVRKWRVWDANYIPNSGLFHTRLRSMGGKNDTHPQCYNGVCAMQNGTEPELAMAMQEGHDTLAIAKLASKFDNVYDAARVLFHFTESNIFLWGDEEIAIISGKTFDPLMTNIVDETIFMIASEMPEKEPELLWQAFSGIMLLRPVGDELIIIDMDTIEKDTYGRWF